MKLLSICDPTQYRRAPLDVPAFYQRLSQDERVDLYHLPSPRVLGWQVPEDKKTTLSAIASTGLLPYTDFVQLGEQPPTDISFSEIDLVFCRTLKPFSDGYLNQLSEWEKSVRFVNSPTGKQTQMRSDFLPSIAKDYMPETLVTDSYVEAIAFFEKYQTVVAKQANSCGGRGVFKIWHESGYFQLDNILTGCGSFATFAQVMAFLQHGQTEPLQFCRYLHRTQEGDKRVVVVDGEIYGSYLRRSKSGHWVNNVSQDGECSLSTISDSERTAIQDTVGYYQDLGLHTLGYDFLMDNNGTWKISEINAGNIGGFARLELLTGEPMMNRLIDWLLAFSKRMHSSKAVQLPPRQLQSCAELVGVA